MEPTARPDDIEDVYPLTPTQEGMLFHVLLAPESAVYFEQQVFQLRGELDVAALRGAWDALVARHSALRTGFVWEGLSRPVQVVRRRVRLPWAEHDWSGLSSEEQERWFQIFLAADQSRGFDLTQAPPMRFTLLRLGDGRWRLVWSYSHLLMDGWGLPIVLGELARFYEGSQTGALPELPPVRPFGDYVAWLEDQDEGPATEYWSRRLAGVTEPTPLGMERTRPASGHIEVEVEVPDELRRRLVALARELHTTVNTVLQGAWALLLSRYGDAEDVLFGVVDAGRTPELDGSADMVGLFINTVPLRVRVDGAATVRQWLVGLHADLVAQRPFRHLGLVRIQACSDIPRGGRLFDSILVPGDPDSGQGEAVGFGEAELEVLELHERDNYPLSVRVATPGKRLVLAASVDRSRFDEAAPRRVLDQLLTALTGMVDHPDSPLSAIEILGEPERQRVLVDWNATEPQPRRPTEAPTVHQRFEARVAEQPDAPAVVCGDTELSYRELDRQANRLAHRLVSLGVDRDVPVGVCLDRSADLLVSLLAIFKAGGCYVPLDPRLPLTRLSFTVADTRAPMVITHRGLSERLPADIPAVLDLDRDRSALAAHSDAPVDRDVAGQDLAYILHTSGSTGTPKGVMVEHRSLVAFLDAAIDVPGLARSDVVAATTELCFDISTLELFGPLVVGARVLLIDDDDLVDPCRLGAVLTQGGATVVQATPSRWRSLVETGSLSGRRRRALCGGEPLTATLAEDLCTCAEEVWNLYGPTEATVWATVQRVTPGSGSGSSGPPIGRPLPGYRVYVVDRHGRPTPIGVPGELLIGGLGIARGYLDRPELTAERFVDSRFVAGDRLYRTGDRASWQPDGTLEFLGRLDNQVKIRGHRVEPGEIEAVLVSHDAVRQAAVTTDRDATGDCRLTAYLVTSETGSLTVPALRAFLAERLPAYMIPASFVFLPALPLTPNGKVDRKALPAPTQARPALGGEFVPPRNDIEEALAALWAEVLQVDRVGVHDDFFALGGDSLLATRLVARARAAFAADVALCELYDDPTVRGMATTIDGALAGALLPGDGKGGAAGPTQLSRDAELAAAITPTVPVEPRPSPATRPLLTGATTFLGAFVLAELLRIRRGEVICLLPADDRADGQRRIAQRLEELELDADLDLDRIVAVPGTLSRERFGLDERDFRRLADDVDAVYHLGQVALGPFVPYAAFGLVNVGGTREVLRLAASGHAKPCHLVSTLSIVPLHAADPDAAAPEAPIVSCDAVPPLGFTQSMWVAETLALAAAERGVPIHVYRLGEIVGHVASTAADPGAHLTRLLVASIRFGVVPRRLRPRVYTTVDYAARAIGHLSAGAGSDPSSPRIFHVADATASRPTSLRLARWLQSFGYHVDELPEAAWWAAIDRGMRTGRDDRSSWPARHAEDLRRESRWLRRRYDVSNTAAGLAGSGITTADVDEALFHRLLEGLCRRGVVEPPPP